ncbi:O-antigen ligase family protein [Candidatus Sumerlaeota bacterium]|nr:O-antigen ligase family protein [Candidatus Sumerlaeota bacterium]
MNKFDIFTLDSEKDRDFVQYHSRMTIKFYLTGILISLCCGIAFAYKGFMPAIVIGGLLGSLIMINHPFLVFCIFVSLVGFEALQAIRPSDIYSITGIKIAGFVLFASVLPKVALRPIRVKLGLQAYAIGLFMLFCLASFFNSANIIASLSGTLTFFQLVILWFAVRMAIDKKEKIRIIAQIIMLVLAVSAAVGVWQYYTESGARISGISQNAAILSSDLFVGLWFGLALLGMSGSRFKHFIYTILLILTTLGILFSLSRAAYIAFIPSILTGGIYYGKPGLTIGLLILFLILIMVFAPFTIERLRETSLTTDASTKGHINSLEAGLEILGDHPFLGVGIGNYADHYLRYTNDVRRLPRTPHNSYLAIGSEIGVFGLIAFVILHISAFYSLWKTSKKQRMLRDRNGLLLTCAIAGSLSAFCVIGMFHTLQISKFLWILLGLGGKLPEIIDAESKP